MEDYIAQCFQLFIGQADKLVTCRRFKNTMNKPNSFYMCVYTRAHECVHMSVYCMSVCVYRTVPNN